MNQKFEFWWLGGGLAVAWRWLGGDLAVRDPAGCAKRLQYRQTDRQTDRQIRLGPGLDHIWTGFGPGLDQT